ncbi:hypothetical protein Q7A53_05245 [Halobacillus rhizosphaerae]|uniref:hypothetical protein n=1 Tax=Halobacillus rhizosphaerae TaxID=3064889 RepID=UPI00398B9B37
MKYSKLAHDIEIMKLNHKHEAQLLEMKQNMELNELLEKCTHTFDDGTSARKSEGTQWDSYCVCEICNEDMN